MDMAYKRLMRVDEKCSTLLRHMSGFREMEE